MKSNYDNATDFEKRFEKIKTMIFSDAVVASKALAAHVVALIKQKAEKGEYCVLGLPTGVSPKPLYAELVRLHKEEGVSFSNVICFNLDEYYPMASTSLFSYVRFMHEALFDHIDIKKENCHIPSGEIGKDQINEYCLTYERDIDSVGGIDLQILGIGGNGHIGFNESGSLKNSKTRLVALDESTRIAASSVFKGLVHTPKTAITLGVKKILEAKEIVVMAWGENKAVIVKKAVEGAVNDQVPATYLQEHTNTTFILDKAAALALTRVQSPWRVDEITWDASLIKTAVIRLAIKKGKHILELQDSDYIENGMSTLLTQNETIYEINKQVVAQLANTINDLPFVNKSNASRKRILIFSPHPDDDIISMGGTFRKLVALGHEVHVAYQTSGNIAVADDEALRFTNFVCDFNEHFSAPSDKRSHIYAEARTFLASKTDSQKDTEAVRFIKGLIRKSEARATCRFVGLPEEHIHFMNLPFYETGEIQKHPLGKKDVRLTVQLLQKIQPDVVFAAGDLADPHGTHKVCLDAVLLALSEVKKTGDSPALWLYRGAWQEWPIEEIQLAVPLSPDEVLLKRYGIFKHQSQKDGVVFQGADSREFWQRAEDRNRETAQLYKRLGLASYPALEAFVQMSY